MKAFFKNAGIICQRELISFFSNTASYVMLLAFLFMLEFLFFRSVFLVREASLRIYLDWLPWLLLLLVPAVSMGAIAQEKGDGTIELALTQPVRDGEWLAGKFFARLILIAATLLLPILLTGIGFNMFGDLQWGVTLAQYLAGVLFAASLTGLCIFISSLTSSQIAALIVSVTASFFWMILGFEIISARLPLFLAPLLEQLSIYTHLTALARGVIDLRDIVFFVSAPLIWLTLALYVLSVNRAGSRKDTKKIAKTGTALLIAGIIVFNVLLLPYSLRLDVTADGLFTMSKSSKQVLANLPDVVRITLYASKELPTQFQPVLRDTKDLLRDYGNYGKGNIVVLTKYPSNDPEAETRASQLGIQQVRFNVVGSEEFQVKNGYLGVAIEYAGEHEVIPFIQSTQDLEYQLTIAIRKLTKTTRQNIGFLSGHGEPGIYEKYSRLNEQLSDQFLLREVIVSEQEPAIPADLDVLVVPPTRQEYEEFTVEALKNYLGTGGSLMVYGAGVNIQQEILYATQAPVSAAGLLSEYGIQINPDLVYDLRSNETVRFGGGMITYFLPYPFWVKALPAGENMPVLNRISAVLLPWTSSVTADSQKLQELGFSYKPLLKSTAAAGRQTQQFMLAPNQQLSQDNLSEAVLAYQLERGDQRIIVVGNDSFLDDDTLNGAAENTAFAINAFAWLAQDDSLADLQVKQLTERPLIFNSPGQMTALKYAIITLTILIPLGSGTFYLLRRRSLRFKSYS